MDLANQLPNRAQTYLTNFLIAAVFWWVLLVSGAIHAQVSETISEIPTIGSWRVGAPMEERREYAGGVLLNDGKVLAVSGHPLEGKSLASAELYDPTTGEWNNTGALREPRNGGNSATLLGDGRVLIAGGHNSDRVLTGVELFDPASGTWSETRALSVGRDPVPTLLSDGRVLVAGGIDWYTDDGKVYPLAELYNPETGKWSVTGSLNVARSYPRSVLLDDGRVLLVAGYGSGRVLLKSVEIYDPSTGEWELGPDLPEDRSWFEMVKLRDGRVFVAGGYTGTSSRRTYLSSALIFDPKTGGWSSMPPMREARGGFSMTLLADGRVLVAGGVAESGAELKSCELFDPDSNSWQAVAPMKVARRNHRATLLPNGDVLVIGGSNLFGGNYLNSCELFSLRPNAS